MSIAISWFVIIALLASWSLLVDLTVATWFLWFAGCILLVAAGAITHVLIGRARERRREWLAYRQPIEGARVARSGGPMSRRRAPEAGTA